jgi:hypothetical protein
LFHHTSPLAPSLLALSLEPAAAPVLDKQFHLTFSLTYRTFGGRDRDVNTEPFRSAVWFYVQRLYGVRNDHYDYALVRSRGSSGQPF